MLMVSVALVMAVVVTNIYLRKDAERRVPVCLRKIFLSNNKRRTSLSNKVTMSENHVCDTKMQEIEIDALSNHSEVDTLTCHARCSRVSLAYKPPELDTNQRHACEWMQLAKCIDRVFFWLFLISSVAALVSMGCEIPSISPT